jgi:hypothetical protein
MSDQTLFLIQCLREMTEAMTEPSGPSDIVQHAGISRLEIARELRLWRRKFGRQFTKDTILAFARHRFGQPAPIERAHLRGI